jgi:hypothetical protein
MYVCIFENDLIKQIENIRLNISNFFRSIMQKTDGRLALLLYAIIQTEQN